MRRIVDDVFSGVVLTDCSNWPTELSQHVSVVQIRAFNNRHGLLSAPATGDV